jgi:hypothetical protein
MSRVPIRGSNRKSLKHKPYMLQWVEANLNRIGNGCALDCPSIRNKASPHCIGYGIVK